MAMLYRESGPVRGVHPVSPAFADDTPNRGGFMSHPRYMVSDTVSTSGPPPTSNGPRGNISSSGPQPGA